MRTHFLHPQFRVLSMNIKARRYKARYDKKTKNKKNAFRQKYVSVLSFKCSTWIYGSYAPPGTGEGRASPTVTAIRVNMNEI